MVERFDILVLALVTEQRFDFPVDDTGDVDELLGIRAAHDPHLGRGVRLQAPFGQQFGEGKFVPCIGVDGRERRLSDSKMIGMTRVDAVVSPIGGLGEHPVRFDRADDRTDLAAEIEICKNLAILEAEKVQLGNAEHFRGGRLFGAANLCHSGAGNGVVEAACLSVGDEAIDDFVTLVHPCADGASSTKIGIIRVGGDNEDLHDSSRYRTC